MRNLTCNFIEVPLSCARSCCKRDSVNLIWLH